MSALPDDYWVYEEPTQSLHGRRTRMSYHLAQDVEVRLTEASPVTGGLLFQVLGEQPARQAPLHPAGAGGQGSAAAGHEGA